MHDEIFVANESLEELRSLRQVVQDLVAFGEARNKFVKQLIALEDKEQLEKIEIQQLKFVLSIKLQKLLLTFTFTKQFSTSLIAATYDKIISIWEEIDGKLHINEKILHLKIIQALLDYKICEKYGIQQKFCFQELLPIIEQHRQFQNIYSKKDEQYEMLFLGLVMEFMRKQEVQNYLQMHKLAVNFIKQKLQKLKKELKPMTHELVVKQLLILLNLHLSYKLLKKHLKFQDQNLDQSVYILLYDLEYSITEKLTIQYKKYYGKTTDEAINFSAQKLKSFIVDLDSGLTFDNDLLQTKKNEKLSVYRIKRSSASLNDLKKKHSNQKIRSLKKIDQKKLQIKNQMYIPQKINFNKKLQHKNQFKVQKKKLQLRTNVQRIHSQISIKSIKYPEKQAIKVSENTIQMQFTISKDQIDDNIKQTVIKQQQKLSYTHCMKNIRTPTQQLEQMLCLRPSNNIGQISLIKSNAKLEQSSNVIISKRNRSKISLNRRISHNYNSIRTVQDKLEVNDIGKRNHSTLYVPPLIKKNLYKFIRSFLIFTSYQLKRKEMPFYKELISLDPSKMYYIFGNIFKIYSTTQSNLIFKVHFLLNNKYSQKVSIDLKKLTQIGRIKQQFITSKSKDFIYEMFYLGKDINLFKLNIKAPPHQVPFVKHEVNSIRYEYQIYAYSVYVNTKTYSKFIIKKILKRQQKYMDQINQQLEIQFDYIQQSDNREIAQQKLINSNDLKFYHFFNQKELSIDHNVILIQSHTRSLKYLTTFSTFQIKLYKCTDRQKYYLILENKSEAKLMVVCKKITIQQIFKDVRTLSELKSSIINKDKIYFECWSDVILNKAVLKPQLKNYCVRGQKGYKIYCSKVLIENQLKLIYGIHNEIKWFVFISLLQIQPIWLKTLPNSRERKFKSSKSFKSTKKQIKGHDVGIELCLMEHFKYAKIINEELHLNKQIYRYSTYEDHWIYYQNKKKHYCFKNIDRIQYFTIAQNQLMYISSLKLVNTSSKDSIFEEFRNHLALNYKILKITLFQFNLIVKIRCDLNKLLCTFESQDVEYKIQIDRSQFTLFHQKDLLINDKFLHHKSFRNRLTGIVKEKIYEINHRIY